MIKSCRKYLFNDSILFKQNIFKNVNSFWNNECLALNGSPAI